MLNGEKLEAFPPEYGSGQGCPLSPVLHNIVMQVLAKAVRHEKEISGTQIEEGGRLPLFADDMIIWGEAKSIVFNILNVLDEKKAYKVSPIHITYKNLLF